MEDQAGDCHLPEIKMSFNMTVYEYLSPRSKQQYHFGWPGQECFC
jgi:hypothetical protein